MLGIMGETAWKKWKAFENSTHTHTHTHTHQMKKKKKERNKRKIKCCPFQVINFSVTSSHQNTCTTSNLPASSFIADAGPPPDCLATTIQCSQCLFECSACSANRYRYQLTCHYQLHSNRYRYQLTCHYQLHSNRYRYQLTCHYQLHSNRYRYQLTCHYQLHSNRYRYQLTCHYQLHSFCLHSCHVGCLALEVCTITESCSVVVKGTASLHTKLLGKRTAIGFLPFDLCIRKSARLALNFHATANFYITCFSQIYVIDIC